LLHATGQHAGIVDRVVHAPKRRGRLAQELVDRFDELAQPVGALRPGQGVAAEDLRIKSGTAGAEAEGEPPT
jgi:hypothetical protein